MKTSLVHGSATEKQSSTTILVGLTAVFGFRIFSTDVCQAYSQSADELMRDVYINSGKKFELSSNQILKMVHSTDWLTLETTGARLSAVALTKTSGWGL